MSSIESRVYILIQTYNVIIINTGNITLDVICNDSTARILTPIKRKIGLKRPFIHYFQVICLRFTIIRGDSKYEFYSIHFRVMKYKLHIQQSLQESQCRIL